MNDINSPKNRSLRDRVRYLREQNDWLSLIGLLNPLAQSQKEADAFVLSSLGFAYSQIGQGDKARYCYKGWLEKEPGSPVPLYCLGYLEYYEGHWRQAVEWFDLALEENPDYMRCLYRKGVALYNMGKTLQCLETLHRAADVYERETDPAFLKTHAKFYFKALFYRAKALLAREAPRQALPLLDLLLTPGRRRYVQETFLRYNRAVALHDLGAWDQALETLKKVPPSDYALTLAARCHMALGRPEAARRCFERALKKRRAAYILVRRAEMWRRGQRPDRAEADLREALRRDRVGKHKIYLLLAGLYMEREDFPAALELFSRANAFRLKRYGGEDYHALLGMGRCFDRLNRPREARRVYGRAAAMNVFVKENGGGHDGYHA